jgi:hypothetical protein
VYIPYVKGVSEKLKRIGNRYNMRTIFRTKHTLRSSLRKTRPERDPQQTAVCLQNPCECGRSYIGETGRPLAVRVREHTHNLKQSLIEISKRPNNVGVSSFTGTRKQVYFPKSCFFYFLEYRTMDKVRKLISSEHSDSFKGNSLTICVAINFL